MAIATCRQQHNVAANKSVRTMERGEGCNVGNDLDSEYGVGNDLDRGRVDVDVDKNARP